ncbi:ATP synthase F0 subunit B [Candidatus Aminicenantes bacterium AC-335-A11]|nr:ATP synthase F0 subunit B [SCandidatus Aminicenantes bacterium Aminicenantia_JdfR_composite]MCP2596420.1 ATP synthase F0 subunit B [Candidatus Aminicenantes bacterium AC-335-G13]MCP2618202.1 ATP synthase F0 subunit B [Candidatus Aminicenantes bacterium AC-335-A11]MCP2620999.1 ATP synthase F0 subunit B [Candidatus Aminicenantes bacterium AC-334-E05]
MRKSLFFLPLLLIIFSPLYSSVKENSFNWSDFIGKIINAVILFGFLAYVLYKPLKNYLIKRSGKIKDTYNQAESQRKDAEKQLAQIEERLKNLEKEIIEIRKESELNAQKERDRIIKEGLKEAERIKNLTQKEIERQLKKGFEELKSYAVELSILIAEEKIKKTLTPEKHKYLIDKFIEKIEKVK